MEKNSSQPQADRGRSAENPAQMPAAGWKDVAVRTWKESSKDNVGLVAAGVAFYGFLALVPLLGAIVITYGFMAEPQTVVSHFQALTKVLPAQVAELIGEMLLGAVQSSGEKKGLGLLLALAIALWGAKNAAGSIITALNIAYEEEEKRGFLKVTLIALAMTLGAVVVVLLAIGATTLLGALHHIFPETGPVAIILWKVVSYALLAVAAAAAVATLYRYAPSREKARWSWITPGSLFAAIAWLLLTLGFGFYVTNFGNYDKTYGSLGAIVVLLTWMYLSAYVLLFGAELNSELEHQTARDTTPGPEQPLGSRGAWSADHVASDTASEQGSANKEKTQGGPEQQPRGLPMAAPAVAIPQQAYDHPYVTSRLTARAAGAAGIPKIGMISSILSTAGLALLRRRGKEGLGAAVLVTAAGLALARREPSATVEQS
jgi:membrane protein